MWSLARRVQRGGHTLRRLLWTAESRGDEVVLREEGRELRFPHPWLRDNCQCPSCFHPASRSRIINIQHFDFDAKPLKHTMCDSWLEVSWSDAHESRYSLPWLLAHQFRSHSHRPHAHAYRPIPRPWTGSQFLDILERFQYKDILDKDEVLLKWLENLAVKGVAVVQGAGSDTGKLQPLADRVAFLKQTYYGETFSVNAKPGTSNVAYLAGSLQLHTDLPYYHYKPGINLLHCVTQGTGGGGESELADGLSVCEWLRAEHPLHYWILATVPVQWEDEVWEDGQQHHAIHQAPVICESADGEVERVNWSQPQRGSLFPVPVDQVTPWYRALKVFAQRVHSEHSKVRYRMAPGEILTFNNLRLLHGRASYEGERHLEGGYLDWDYIHSRIRVLRQQLL